MNHFWISAVFTILALGGLAMIIHGLRLKPGNGREAEDVLLNFSGGEDENVLDLEMSAQSMERQEKEAFDPKKHRPQALEGRKE